MTIIDWSKAPEGYTIWIESFLAMKLGNGWHAEFEDRFVDQRGCYWLKSAQDTGSYLVHRRPSLQPSARNGSGDAVATIQLPDIYDERDGLWLSNEDMKRLMALPAGTKLFTSPTKPDAELVALLQDAGAAIKSVAAHFGSHSNELVKRIDAKLVELKQ